MQTLAANLHMPDAPTAARIGGAFLTLATLQRLHADATATAG